MEPQVHLTLQERINTLGCRDSAPPPPAFFYNMSLIPFPGSASEG